MKPIPYRDVKRKLESAGFSITTQKGSHIKFIKTIAEGTLTVIVPYHSLMIDQSMPMALQ
jgi:predicted RNA binding protein YcfA (HicA-like mRNA interferase family)